MSIQKSINLTVTGFIVALASIVILFSVNVSAQDGETNNEAPADTQSTESENTENAESSAESTPGKYDYVAQPGDSYSLMARKAIQTLGVNNSVNLSGAQIIFVETNLTKAAGSPEINEGQNVTIDEQLLTEWVEKAKSLTEEQQALWQPYADNANFNTDAVGQVAN